MAPIVYGTSHYYMSEELFPKDTHLAQEIERDDKIADAVFAFNVKQRTGIPLLCSAFGVPNEPKYIAHILHSAEGLMSDKIGIFFSKKENEAILEAYFNELELRLPILKAMRVALSSSFRLPGEGQQISQIVDVFAKVYLQQNKNISMSLDLTTIMAYALILLNSDLHNASNPRKMKLFQFINNLRGAGLKDSDFSDYGLTQIYNEIRDVPFVFNQVASDFLALSAPQQKGYLKKKSSSWKSVWTRHYFVLANSCLYYFIDNSNKNSDRPKGVVQLVSVEATPGRNDTDLKISSETELQFIKFKKRRPDLIYGLKSMTLRAPTKQLRDKWLYRIKTSIVFLNFSNEGQNCVQNIDANAVPESSTTSMT